MEWLEGFIIGTFKNCLNGMEDNLCRCGQTPSEVGEEFVSSEEEGRMELSYSSTPGSEYAAPPMENPIPIPVPAPAPCCLGSTTALSPLKEITKEATFICDDLDSLLREADEERARDLQEGSSNSVVHLPP